LAQRRIGLGEMAQCGWGDIPQADEELFRLGKVTHALRAGLCPALRQPESPMPHTFPGSPRNDRGGSPTKGN
jgi:hypothetical protein